MLTSLLAILRTIGSLHSTLFWNNGIVAQVGRSERGMEKQTNIVRAGQSNDHTRIMGEGNRMKTGGLAVVWRPQLSLFYISPFH